jgi:hypothetical protein
VLAGPWDGALDLRGHPDPLAAARAWLRAAESSDAAGA